MREVPQHLPETVSLLDTLRMAIYRGELTPGQRLVETELATRYETSRGSVREALVLLSNEGLVSRERNRGAWVRPVSLEEAIEITEARAVLEGLCAAKAAAAATRADARELKAVGKKMSEAVKNGDVVRYNTTSQEVHMRVREIAGQQTAAAILERLRYQSVRYQFHVSLLPGRMAQGLKEHLAIIDAVTSRDPEVAERTMREHLLSVIGALHQLAELGASPIPVAAAWR
ncbi:MAG TPA: GntR family transcriptional regulator [Streptosporangiaceae bacterium]|nr:GntR family transcriptional regulator [Streptosporangiaceae bacterium]